MTINQYPLKIEKEQRNKLQKIADNERRSLNQTILLIIDKYLGEVENGGY